MQEDDKALATITSYVKTYFAVRFLIAFVVMTLVMISAVIFVCYQVFQQIKLEVHYHEKFGANWQAEFERYHGTISHAHTQIVVGASCMVALVLVLSGFCYTSYRAHKKPPSIKWR